MSKVSFHMNACAPGVYGKMKKFLKNFLFKKGVGENYLKFLYPQIFYFILLKIFCGSFFLPAQEQLSVS